MQTLFEWLRVEPKGFDLVQFLGGMFLLKVVITGCLVWLIYKSKGKPKNTLDKLLQIGERRGRVEMFTAMIDAAIAEEILFRLPLAIMVICHMPDIGILVGAAALCICFGMVHGGVIHILIQGIGGAFYSAIFLKCGGMEGKVLMPFLYVLTLHLFWNTLNVLNVLKQQRLSS